MKSTTIPSTSCPHAACGGPLNQAVSIKERSFVAGSLSLCKWCDGIIRIGADLRLEVADEATLTDKEARQLVIGRRMLLDILGPAPRPWTKASPGKAMPATKRLRVVYKRMDAAWAQTLPLVPEPPSCKRGCDACCHYRSHATPIEAELLVEVVRERGGADAVQALGERARAALDATGHPDAAGYHAARVACPLLQAGECTVYDVRPGLCRAFWVSSEPQFCELGGHTRQLESPLTTKLFLDGVKPLTASGFLPIEFRDLNWQILQAVTGAAPTPWPTTHMTPIGPRDHEAALRARLRVVK